MTEDLPPWLEPDLHLKVEAGAEELMDFIRDAIGELGMLRFGGIWRRRIREDANLVWLACYELSSLPARPANAAAWLWQRHHERWRDGGQ
ncbi:MAG TPA: hypothetical protein VGO11_19795 [Chthoniobacteraceae bacterium]|nr:hypothetical protein [Chthoniobacteraceae bacterium]